MKSIMVTKRTKHDNVISKFHDQNDGEDNDAEEESTSAEAKKEEPMEDAVPLEDSTQADVMSAFSTIVQPKPVTHAKVFKTKKRKREPKVVKDEENYIGYQAKDHATEAG